MNNLLIENKIALTIVLTILLSCSSINAQTQRDKERYEKEPVWIEMMKDTSSNYYETIEAFRLFFKDRYLPEEPKIMSGGDNFEKLVGLEEENEAGKKSEEEIERENREQDPNERNYMFEVKQFKLWLRDAELWLRPDGTIIQQTERQAIIDKQQNELKEVERLNNKN